MADFYTKQNDAVTHPTIVHELLKKIVIELSTHEFRGGYEKPVINGGVTYLDYVPDSRSEYIQSIEALADILLPQYDGTMKKNYQEYEEELLVIEESLNGKDVRMGDDEHSKFTKRKLVLIRRLFRDLNQLLKRTNYLKKKAYSEGDEDEEDDDEEDD